MQSIHWTGNVCHYKQQEATYSKSYDFRRALILILICFDGIYYLLNTIELDEKSSQQINAYDDSSYSELAF